MPYPKRILLTGGGTAGHVNPALAIGAALRGPAAELLFVGVRGRAEEKVVPREGIPVRFVRASGFPGSRPSLALATFALDLACGTLQAALILQSFRPDLIVGTGGYVSAPVVFAAAILRRLGLQRAPIYLHEQNAVPGKLNLLAGRLATRVFVTFAETLSQFPGNGVLSGYPLRKRIGSVSREDAEKGLDFEVPPGRTVVLVFGGSLGSRTLNRALIDSLRDLMPHAGKLFLVHGMGLASGRGYEAVADTEARLAASYSEEERRTIAGFYVSRPYFHDIENVYSLAGLAVVRAGAGTLNELATVGLPALVVPKANLPGDHQVANARALERAGGAEVLYEETALEDGCLVERLDGSLLARRILALVSDPALLARMSALSRAFLVRDALGTIEALILRGEEPPAPALPDGAVLPAALPSDAVLLSRLERTVAAGGRDGPSDPGLEPCDRAYFASRAASALADGSWEVRNRGVKLLGLLGVADKVPLLVALLRDRRPAPFLQRLFGGDFVQVGFVRRNAVVALGRLGARGPDVEEVLLAALSDPYYEVRAQAARVVGARGAALERRADFARALAAAAHQKSLEAAAAAAEALGEVGDEATALPELLALSAERYWKLRAAALNGLLALVKRGEAGDPARLEEMLARFPLTSTDFAPRFEMKAAYRRVAEAARRSGGAG